MANLTDYFGLTREDLEDLLRDQERELDVMRGERAEAIALLKPARPEDGLLPAVRDVMQRVVITEPALQRLRAQRGELIDAVNTLINSSPRCGCCQCSNARAAIAKAEGES